MTETPEERAERHYALARYWEEQWRFDKAVLEQRVAELEREVAELRAQVAALRA